MLETPEAGDLSHQQVFSEDERTNLLPQWPDQPAERLPVQLQREAFAGLPICINLCTAVGESLVMLSATKHLGPRVRSFASLRMTNVEVA